MITYEPKNWFRVLFDFPRSPVFRTLALDVLLAGAWGGLVAWFELAVRHTTPAFGSWFLSILGIILSLLLVFRTNTAYDRWWEGRKLWGQLVNVSRGLAHQLDALLPDGAPQRAAYAEVLAQFPTALAAHLRRPRGKPGAALGAGASIPNQIVRALARRVHGDVAAGALPREATVALTPLLTAFDDVTGACERIRNTPIPFAYSSYVKQYVLVYAIVLPFGLVRDFGYYTAGACMLMFFATMGLELLAGEVEEPFGSDPNDLPLDEIAERIAVDVRALLGPPDAGGSDASVSNARMSDAA